MEIILKNSRLAYEKPDLHNKAKKGCIQTRSTPVSFSPVTVKWAIPQIIKKPIRTIIPSTYPSPKPTLTLTSHLA